MISPMTYIRYKGAAPYLKARHNLEPLCGVWFGVAINQVVTGSTSTHLDFGDFEDSGYNCVVPWGRYNGGGLVLWQLETMYHGRNYRRQKILIEKRASYAL